MGRTRLMSPLEVGPDVRDSPQEAPSRGIGAFLGKLLLPGTWLLAQSSKGVPWCLVLGTPHLSLTWEVAGIAGLHQVAQRSVFVIGQK